MRLGRYIGLRGILTPIVLTAACGVSAGDPPVWFTSPYEVIPDSFYVGVGMASAGETPEENWQQSLDRALANLAKTIEVRVESVVEDTAQASRRGDAVEEYESFRSYARTRTDQTIREYRVYDRQYDPRNEVYYTCVVLSKNRYFSAMNALMGEAFSRLEDAKTALFREGAQALSAAIEDLTGAAEVCAGVVHPNYVLRVRSLREEIGRLLDGLGRDLTGAAISGQGQEGEWGEPLARPFSVRWTWRGELLRDFPVVFRFVRGAGVLRAGDEERAVCAVRTDEDGVATCQVSRVLSLSGTNRVGASLQGLSPSPENPLAPMVPKGTEVLFAFPSFFSRAHRSSGLAVKINGSGEERAFREGDALRVSVRSRTKGYVSLFVLDAEGELRFVRTFSTLRERSGGKVRVRHREGWWELAFSDPWRVNKRSGSGVESVLAVLTGRPPGFEGSEPEKCWTREELLRILSECDPWQTAYTSYVIVGA